MFLMLPLAHSIKRGWMSFQSAAQEYSSQYYCAMLIKFYSKRSRHPSKIYVWEEQSSQLFKIRYLYYNKYIIIRIIGL